ncbi:hypothetical protein BDB01DRAFT_897957 [Pilobolus umbonatus]|nr:hypothetical protein BDB01DRAFT_897957 [Pilobolus umbonatus]
MERKYPNYYKNYIPPYTFKPYSLLSATHVPFWNKSLPVNTFNMSLTQLDAFLQEEAMSDYESLSHLIDYRISYDANHQSDGQQNDSCMANIHHGNNNIYYATVFHPVCGSYHTVVHTILPYRSHQMSHPTHNNLLWMNQHTTHPSNTQNDESEILYPLNVYDGMYHF